MAFENLIKSAIRGGGVTCNDKGVVVLNPGEDNFSAYSNLMYGLIDDPKTFNDGIATSFFATDEGKKLKPIVDAITKRSIALFGDQLDELMEALKAFETEGDISSLIEIFESDEDFIVLCNESDSDPVALLKTFKNLMPPADVEMFSEVVFKYCDARKVSPKSVKVLDVANVMFLHAVNATKSKQGESDDAPKEEDSSDVIQTSPAEIPEAVVLLDEFRMSEDGKYADELDAQIPIALKFFKAAKAEELTVMQADQIISATKVEVDDTTNYDDAIVDDGPFKRFAAVDTLQDLYLLRNYKLTDVVRVKDASGFEGLEKTDNAIFVACGKPDDAPRDMIWSPMPADMPITKTNAKALSKQIAGK